MSLRKAALRIASELPAGDPVRREILSALKGGALRAGKTVTVTSEGDGLGLVSESNPRAGVALRLRRGQKVLVLEAIPKGPQMWIVFEIDGERYTAHPWASSVDALFK